MKLEATVEIPFPRSRVFEVYRDRLPELVPYLPNIRGIDVVERQDDGEVTRLQNRWRGGGEIPAAARSFLSEKLLEWDDHATWDAKAFTTDWRVVVPSFKDAVNASGTNTFEALGADRTRFRILGALAIDAGKIPGIPKLLSRTVAPIVERFLVAAIKPNLVEVTRGVERYLREKGG